MASRSASRASASSASSLGPLAPTAAPPILALTCGDPAGVGMEVLGKALAGRPAPRDHALLLLAAPAHLEAEPAWAPLRAALRRVRGPHEVDGPGTYWQPLPGPSAPPAPARYDPAWARVARLALDLAAADARAGRVHGVVTAPICKAITVDLAPSFAGQTELFGAAGGAEPVMMLAGPRLRVVPITGHLPLRDVPDALTASRIEHAVRTTLHALRHDFGLASPRVGVCGLNPHAGEAGRLGREELDVMIPALDRLRAEGLPVSGPHPADSYFALAVRGAADAVLCAYHDQGLAPLKLLHFDDAVNVTLGLSFVRTSPDHGTAYDLAGRDRASERSTRAALDLAWDHVRRRAASDAGGAASPDPARPSGDAHPREH